MASTYCEFTKEEFEAVMPRQFDGRPLFSSAFVMGEYEYTISIPSSKVSIIIRSTIRKDGKCAPVGEDSIRLWLADAFRKPLMTKLQRHVARTTHWASNLSKQIERLTWLARQIGVCGCGHTNTIMRVKNNQNGNQGRLFRSCPSRCPESFKWIEEENEA